MGLLDRFWKKSKPAPEAQHAVIVHLVLSDEKFGTQEERDAIRALGDEMEAQLVRAVAGEFDGDEFGGGECTLWMYGTNADRVFGAVEPALRASPLSKGGHVIKRYGDVDDEGAKRVRIDL